MILHQCRALMSWLGILMLFYALIPVYPALEERLL